MTAENSKICDLCVPYRKGGDVDNNNAVQNVNNHKKSSKDSENNKRNLKYLLYSVTYTNDDSWTLECNNNDTEKIDKRFESYRDYFKKQCNLDDEECIGKFGFKNILNQFDSYKKEIETLTKDCTSVLLGIFLRAAKIFHNYKFKKNWRMICVTGVIEYKDGKLKLLEAEDILEKYKDEFLIIAKENKNDEYLFLYINDKELIKSEEPKPDNVIIKRYTTENTIWDIYDDVFEPIEVNHVIDDFKSEKQKYFKQMKD